MTPGDEPSILVLNVGSSTIKFGFFPLGDGDDALLRGVLEYSGKLGIVDSIGRKEEVHLRIDRDNAAAGLIEYLKDRALFSSIRATGHRLVHGGATLHDPARIDARVRALLEENIPFAPDHLPAELRAIDEVSRLIPSCVQIACFDTAFHDRMPQVARLPGLPRAISESGVLRYGFHGLSYEFVAEALKSRGELPARTIMAHLGNGASIAAVLNGVCIDTSMGMTPTGGLVMSTRSGDLDPGIMLYLLRSRGLSAEELDDAINTHGGLLGISGSSSDVRDLLAASSTDSRAEDAIAIFCYQASKFIGAYAAALGGIDALVFSGGIGERSPDIRARICEKLEFLGIRIDPLLNSTNRPVISTAQGSVAVRIIETNEEVMIARHVRTFLTKASLL